MNPTISFEFRVSDLLIQSNVILEAFGNSRTNRNDNSSRFGKYIDIQFDFKSDPIGGEMQHYLLEKSRVIKQQIGERNFHCFYQLIFNNGEEFGLNLSATDYNYINQGRCCEVEKIDDKLNYVQVQEAFDVLAFSKDHTLTVWKILAAILHLVRHYTS